MSIQADVEGVLSLANILLVALPAFDEVDDVPRLAGGRGASVVASPGGCYGLVRITYVRITY